MQCIISIYFVLCLTCDSLKSSINQIIFYLIFTSEKSIQSIDWKAKTVLKSNSMQLLQSILSSIIIYFNYSIKNIQMKIL